MTSRELRNSCAIFAAVLACLVGSEAKAQFGQTIITGTPSDNVSSVGGRGPGRMVRAGIGRAQSAVDRGRAPVQITEPKRGDTIRSNAISQSLEGFLTQFNRVLDELLDLLIARAGGTPQTPSALVTGRR